MRWTECHTLIDRRPVLMQWSQKWFTKYYRTHIRFHILFLKNIKEKRWRGQPPFSTWLHLAHLSSTRQQATVRRDGSSRSKCSTASLCSNRSTDRGSKLNVQGETSQSMDRYVRLPSGRVSKSTPPMGRDTSFGVYHRNCR